MISSVLGCILDHMIVLPGLMKSKAPQDKAESEVDLEALVNDDCNNCICELPNSLSYA